MPGSTNFRPSTEPASTLSTNDGDIDPRMQFMTWYYGGDKEAYLTECGYHTLDTAGDGSECNEVAGGVYIPRMLLDTFRIGITRTFMYELFDEPGAGGVPKEEHFGLYNTTGSAGSFSFTMKQSAVAVKAMNTLLGDTPNTNPVDKLNYDVSAGTEPISHVLMQKSNGRFWLAIWRNVEVYNDTRGVDQTAWPNPLKVSVTLTLNSSTRNVVSYPDIAHTGTALGRSNRFGVMIGPRVTLLEIW